MCSERGVQYTSGILAGDPATRIEVGARVRVQVINRRTRQINAGAPHQRVGVPLEQRPNLRAKRFDAVALDANRSEAGRVQANAVKDLELRAFDLAPQRDCSGIAAGLQRDCSGIGAGLERDWTALSHQGYANFRRTCVAG